MVEVDDAHSRLDEVDVVDVCRWESLEILLMGGVGSLQMDVASLSVQQCHYLVAEEEVRLSA